MPTLALNSGETGSGSPASARSSTRKVGGDRGTGLPAKFSNHSLTFVLEDERPILHRFTFIVVAPDSKAFVEKILESDLADTYRPAPGESMKLGPGFGPHDKTPKEDNDFVLYVSAAASLKDLVRLRFKMVMTFSDSLPLVQNKPTAMTQLVVFLFWKCEGWTEASTQERISDWRSRMAELNNHPQNYRPQVVVLAFGVSDEERQQLDQFVQQQQNVKVAASYWEDDEDATCHEAMNRLSEIVLRSQNMRNSRFSFVRSSAQVGKNGEVDNPHFDMACCAIA